MAATITEADLFDCATDPAHRRALEALGPRSAIGIPFTIRGRRLGGIGLFQTRDSGRTFAPLDLSLAEALAASLALAIDRMRLLAAVRLARATKNRFLSVLSHELRSPLATMAAGLDVLRRAVGGERVPLEALEAIERGIGLQARLADGLRDLPPCPVAPSQRIREMARPEGIRLLIVDGNHDTRKLFSYGLRTLGYFVQAAGSAEDALDMLQSEAEAEPERVNVPGQPGCLVILADIGLPGLSGYQLLEHARGIRGNDRTIGIAITGWRGPGDALRAATTGFDASFLKPIDISALDRKIRELANAASGGASRASGSAAASYPVPEVWPGEPLS